VVRLRFRRFWILLGVLLVLATLYVCLRPASGDPPAFAHVDKLQHFAAYLLLTAWFGALFERSRYPWLVLAMLGLGGGIELAQGAMELGRIAAVDDLVANALGVAAGLGVSLVGHDSWLLRIERWLAPT
jgi:VanZ family protein